MENYLHHRIHTIYIDVLRKTGAGIFVLILSTLFFAINIYGFLNHELAKSFQFVGLILSVLLLNFLLFKYQQFKRSVNSNVPLLQQLNTTLQMLRLPVYLAFQAVSIGVSLLLAAIVFFGAIQLGRVPFSISVFIGLLVLLYLFVLFVINLSRQKALNELRLELDNLRGELKSGI